MSKWVQRALKVAKVLMVLGKILGIGLAIGGVISLFGEWSNTATTFFTGDDILILDGIVKLPALALQRFPFHLFISLYCLTFVLEGLSVYLGAKILWQFFDNLLAEQYFTNPNRLLFKRFLKLQLLIIVADIIAAVANTLASSQLHRTPDFLYSMSNWEGDIFELIILVIIYYIFTKGLALKQDADLTI